MSTHIPPKNLSNFRPPAFPGSLFLSFEGIEGAGKSTQIVKTKEFLESKGFRVLVLREPGGTTFGERLRGAILESKAKINPVAETHLFAASRAQLLDEVILKELSVAGTVVICDRYIDSTIAYQGHAGSLGVDKVLDWHDCFPLNLTPHRTFYIRIGLETSKNRQRVRGAPKDYFESQNDDFHLKLIEGYDQAASLFPNRIKVIDGERDFEKIQTDIEQELTELIGMAKQVSNEAHD
jgi:dTMP kinase